MSPALDIWWERRLLGQLTQDRHGELGFVYSPDWLARDDAPALSASLPKRGEPYSRRECRPFFAGLLPEEGQRQAVARVLGVSPGNNFALLDRLGGDVAGALELLPPGETPRPADADGPPGLLDEAGLVNLLDSLPARPLLAGEQGLRLSLAGSQTKVPVVLADGAVALPSPRQPTTHILKPSIPRFPGVTENEAFTMRLAAAAGLDVASVEARAIRDRRFLLVSRYDRATGSDGRVRRIHQEDFCQALAVNPERKYSADGGPTLKNCFELLRRLALRPAVDVLKLLDAVIFNLLVGNADAHGKNFSILYEGDGPRLAPLYDLLATIAYPELSTGMAMKVGRRAMLEEMDARGWAVFAADATLGLPLVRRRVTEIGEAVKARAEGVATALRQPGLDGHLLSRMAEMAVNRATRCLSTTG